MLLIEVELGIEPVLRIRDPVLFYPGSGFGMIIPDQFSGSLEEFFQFWVEKKNKFFDPDPGPGIFLTLGPGWKNWDPVSGINIPDLQHCIETDFTFKLFVSLLRLIAPKLLYTIVINIQYRTFATC
jgi:hypothetical protein